MVYLDVNDAPDGIPVDEQIDTVRRLRGETGVIDITGSLKALKESGYDGSATPEPFKKKLKEMPIQKAVEKAGEALEKTWKSLEL